MCIEIASPCYQGYKDNGLGNVCIPENDDCATGYKDDGR